MKREFIIDDVQDEGSIGIDELRVWADFVKERGATHVRSWENDFGSGRTAYYVRELTPEEQEKERNLFINKRGGFRFGFKPRRLNQPLNPAPLVRDLQNCQYEEDLPGLSAKVKEIYSGIAPLSSRNPSPMSDFLNGKQNSIFEQSKNQSNVNEFDNINKSSHEGRALMAAISLMSEKSKEAPANILKDILKQSAMMAYQNLDIHQIEVINKTKGEIIDSILALEHIAEKKIAYIALKRSKDLLYPNKIFLTGIDFAFVDESFQAISISRIEKQCGKTIFRVMTNECGADSLDTIIFEERALDDDINESGAEKTHTFERNRRRAIGEKISRALSEGMKKLLNGRAPL